MLTVVVVTRNRASLLAECLDSLSRQTAPGDWRVLVVDNDSSDSTNAVAHAYCARDARFSVIKETTLGASRARNRAAQEAVTPYLLYVDDECIFSEGYIALAGDVVARHAPSCFGGPIHARHHAQPPPPIWFKPEYGAFSLPDNNPVGKPPRLSAGNLGVAREALITVGGFPEDYGPIGERLRFGEENAVIAAMWDRFGPSRIVYEPRLVNFHLVRPEKYAWPQIVKDNFLRGMARGRLKAVGFDEDSRAHSLVPEKRSSQVMSCGGAAGRVMIELCDLMLDLTLLRRVTDPHRFPCWQNVVYERWMRYVAAAGFGIGLLKGHTDN